MIKIKELGYKERTVKVRETTIGHLKLTIVAAFNRNSETHPVKVIDLTSGDSRLYTSITDVIDCDWSDNCRIQVIGGTHSYGTDTDYMNIILIQQDEDDTDHII